MWRKNGLLLCVFGCVLFVLLGMQRTSFASDPHPTDRASRWLVYGKDQKLKALGIKPHRHLHEHAFAIITAARLRALQKRGISLRAYPIDEAIPTVYPNLNTMQAKMKALADRHPTLAQWVDLNKRYKTPLTHEKRTIWALKIEAPTNSKTPRPVVLLDSIHHARELITPLVTYDAAKRLLEGYATDPTVKKWLEYYQIWIVPFVNPDGYHHVFTKNKLWRKNRFPNADGSTGVDINRNYPYLWGVCGKNSGQGRSEIYRGSKAASEPETQTMLAFGRRLRPYLYLSYHSYGDEVIVPYVCRTLAEQVLYQKVSQRMGRAANYSIRKASSSGESFEHFYSLYGSFSLLIEVGQSFHPDPSEVEGLLKRARTTWQTILARGMEASLHGQVLDAKTRTPIPNAALQLQEIQYKAGEIRKTRPVDGWFDWLLEARSYQLSVRVAGYRPWSQRIDLSQNRSKSLMILLTPQTSTDDESQGQEVLADGTDSPDASSADRSPVPDSKTPSDEQSTWDNTERDIAQSTDSNPQEAPTETEKSTDQAQVTDDGIVPTNGCGCQADSPNPWSYVYLCVLLCIVWRRRRITP